MKDELYDDGSKRETEKEFHLYRIRVNGGEFALLLTGTRKSDRVMPSGDLVTFSRLYHGERNQGRYHLLCQADERFYMPMLIPSRREIWWVAHGFIIAMVFRMHFRESPWHHLQIP